MCKAGMVRCNMDIDLEREKRVDVVYFKTQGRQLKNMESLQYLGILLTASY